MLHSSFLLRFIFTQELELFEYKNGSYFAVNSLCGTRTFNELCKLGYLKRVGKSKKRSGVSVDFTIVRDEKERLLSAYNKKIVSSDDKKKVVLRKLMGFDCCDSYSAYISMLLVYNERGYYIDKHFRPCEVVGEKVSLYESERISYLTGIDVSVLKNTVVRSSAEVSGDKLKKDLNSIEESLTFLYLQAFK